MKIKYSVHKPELHLYWDEGQGGPCLAKRRQVYYNNGNSGW